jgi:GAF domain-containing protein
MASSKNSWPHYQLAELVEARRGGIETPIARSADDWSTYQLTEFMAMVSASPNEPTAMREAVERAAETLGAEVAAVVASKTVKTAVGFPAGLTPEHELVAIAEGRQDAVDVPGLGSCRAVAVPIDGRVPAQLVLARKGSEPYGAQELALLRGMARVLALTQRMLYVVEGERRLRDRSERQASENAELLTALQERQRLLERLTVIQASISRGVPFEEVVDAIVAGAHDLIGDEVVALRLLDRHDPGMFRVVASAGIDSARFIPITRTTDVGATGRAFKEGRVVVIEDYSASPEAHPSLASDGIEAAMAAPVHDHDEVVGALVVASRIPGRTYSGAEQEILRSLARHASLALADARRHDPPRPVAPAAAA